MNSSSRINAKSSVHRKHDDWDEVHNQMLEVQQTQIQKKSLTISNAGDSDEKEADDVARKVASGESASIHGTGSTINRKEEGNSEITPEFQAKLESSKGSGQSLDKNISEEMGAKMGADFSGVKIHAGGEANQMSESINAKAFTHGQDVYFKEGEFDTSSDQGKELLAHELVHTVQQGGAVSRKIIQRKPEFYPLEPKQATVDSIYPQGGLYNDSEIRRPSVIIDADTTIRSIAKIVLPWFNTAKVPEGSNYVVPQLTEDQMARAIMTFNANYFPLVPNPIHCMTKYHAGLRVPLPMAIDYSENWWVNPSQVQGLANSFDEAWLPYIDQKPAGAVIPKDKDMTAAVDAFLLERSDLLSRAFGLSAKIMTNPTEALPFLKSLFARDGFGHELAIAIVEDLVIHQAGMLASLKDGYEIIGLLYSEINDYTGDLSEDLQKQKERANKVLGPFGVPALTLERDSVRPKDTGALTAGVETSKVTFTGLPPNFEARPTMRAVPNSGGHAHTNNRPAGTLTPASKKTERTNTAEFVYQSPKPGGEVIISLTVGGKTVEATIRVEVPGFVELPASANYDLTGSTTSHPSPNNHWGTPNTIQHLQDIAAEWEQYKTDNNHPTWPKIGYNDISLPMGGIFDISGAWSSPHSEHRIGRNVDFRLGYTSAQKTELRRIINSHGATSIYDEGDHWHLRFPD